MKYGSIIERLYVKVNLKGRSSHVGARSKALVNLGIAMR